MTGGLEQVRVREVRGEHELVPAVLVAGTAVVLHQLADDATLGVPHRETASELGGEAEEIQLHRKLAVVTLLGLLQAVEVRSQGVLALPRGAVDALQHRALLAAPPVSTSNLHEPEMAKPGGAGHVRPAAEIHERVRVAVNADRLARANLSGVCAVSRAGGHALDDLALVRLVREQSQRLGGRKFVADEGLVGLDDLAHAPVDGREVVGAERPAAWQFEVVVEAVLNRRTDGVTRALEQLQHRLGHHVSRGVAEHVPAGIGIRRDDRNGGTTG